MSDTLRACGGSVSTNLTHLQSPGWPDQYAVTSDTTCTFTFSKVSSRVCQVRLDFLDFVLGPPISNNVKCSDSGTTTDYVSLVHSAGSTTREETSHLCGHNTGQHVYLDMGAVGTWPTSQAYIKLKMDGDNWSGYNRRWNILASQIECDSNYHAPQGCLQYFSGNDGQGTVEAFNYNQPTADYIGHLSGDYTVCVRRERGSCSIGWTPPKYSEDKYGLSISGSKTATTSRGSCSNPSPGTASTTCRNQYIRIHGASNSLDGGAPYTFVSTAPATSCDRFCGKKLCAGRGYCEATGDHSIIYCERPPHSQYQLIVQPFQPGGFPSNSTSILIPREDFLSLRKTKDLNFIIFRFLVKLLNVGVYIMYYEITK